MYTVEVDTMVSVVRAVASPQEGCRFDSWGLSGSSLHVLSVAPCVCDGVVEEGRMN